MVLVNVLILYSLFFFVVFPKRIALGDVFCGKRSLFCALYTVYTAVGMTTLYAYGTIAPDIFS